MGKMKNDSLNSRNIYKNRETMDLPLKQKRMFFDYCYNMKSIAEKHASISWIPE